MRFYMLGKIFSHLPSFLDSIVVSIPACHAGDRGSISRRGDFLLRFKIDFFLLVENQITGKFLNVTVGEKFIMNE